MDSLQIKLPSSSLSSELLKIDDVEININISSSISASNRYVSLTGPKYMDIVGDGYFTDSTGTQNLGKSISEPQSSTGRVYFSTGEYNVIFHKKLGLSGIVFSTNLRNVIKLVRGTLYTNSMTTFLCYGITGVDFPIDISWFNIKNCTEFALTSNTSSDGCVNGTITEAMVGTNYRNLDFRNTKIKCDIGLFGNSQNLELFEVANSGFYGSLDDCFGLSKLRLLNVSRQTEITGAVEDLLDAMVSGGRNSGTVNINAGLSGVTYNGELVVQVANKTFYFSDTFERGWSDTAPE